MTTPALSALLSVKPVNTSIPTLESIFAEEPVPLARFIKDRYYLGMPPLSDIQFDAVRHAEQIFHPETYRLMVDGFDPIWEPVRFVNYLTCMFGKCPLKDEEVYDSSNGQWVKIQDWKQSTVMGATANGQLTTAHASESWLSGRGRSLEVVTASGNVSRVYEGHQFLTRSGWVRAHRLQVGDSIGEASRLDCLDPVEMDIREVKLLAYWLGNGSMPPSLESGSSVRLCMPLYKQQMIDEYVGVLESLGLEAVLDIARPNQVSITGRLGRDVCANGHTMTEENTYRYKHFLKCRMCKRLAAQARAQGIKLKSGRRSNKLKLLADKYDLLGKRSRTKVIPTCIFSLPDDQLRIFLSRLWGTDGSFGKNGAEYTSASEELVRGIGKLLRRFGVRSSIQKRHVSWVSQGEKKWDDYWRLQITRRHDYQRFCREIPVLDQEIKQQYLLDLPPMPEQPELRFEEIISITDIGDHDYYDLSVEGLENYVASGGILNHNSGGKDHLCRVISLRIGYLLSCLHTPQTYYGMPELDTIHMLNVAASSSQAMTAFFTPMTRVVKRGWFIDHCEPKQDKIMWAKNIEMISGNSDAENQEGLNLMLGIADELDAFRSKDEMIQIRVRRMREPANSAEGIVEMLQSSAISRFPANFKVIHISYPRFVGSPIMQRLKRAKDDIAQKGEKSRYYASGPWATWEANPLRTREDFADEYEKDPINAAAKFEAKPSRAVDPFFKNTQAIESCTIAYDPDPLAVDYTLETVALAGRAPMQVWKPVYAYGPTLIPVQGAQYVIHADLAVKHDRAGVAMAHVKSWEEVQETSFAEDGSEILNWELRPNVKVDFVIGYEASKNVDPARDIQIRWVRQLIADLRSKGFALVRASWDGYQSTDSMQIIEAAGIETKKISADKDDSVWKNLNDLFSEGRITIPGRPKKECHKPEDDTLLYRELTALMRVNNGKVDHPISGGKDLADAVACAAQSAIEIGGREDPDGAQAYGSGNVFESYGLDSKYAVTAKEMNFTGLGELF